MLKIAKESISIPPRDVQGSTILNINDSLSASHCAMLLIKHKSNTQNKCHPNSFEGFHLQAAGPMKSLLNNPLPCYG